jgi:hypothetical protein
MTSTSSTLMTVGTTSISQLGTAGLVADGSETAVALESDFPQGWARLIDTSRMQWTVQGEKPKCGPGGRIARTTGRCTAQGAIGYALLCGKIA